MGKLPETSISLIEAIAGNEKSTRWYDFYRAYVDGMKAYLYANFPSVDADDIVQETLIALVQCLPGYVYTPDEKGHFRSYLIGIVKHKALDAIRRATSEQRRRDGLEAESEGSLTQHPLAETEAAEQAAWQNALLESALAQLLADTTIAERTRQIFRHLVIAHEPPEQVAAAFGTTRGNVDVIKSRLIGKLQKIVESLERARNRPAVSC